MAKWTRELIIREILRREAAGLGLTAGRKQDVDWALYQAGSRIFGSWRNAVVAAGIPEEAAMSHERWPPSKIIATIQSLSRRRVSLRRAEFGERNANLTSAARRVFGSWSKAVVAAGVNPSRLRTVEPWTRERIIEGILKRALRNEPLKSSKVRPKSLLEAAARVFGTWAAALSAAGVSDTKGIVEAAQRSGTDRPTKIEVIECFDGQIAQTSTKSVAEPASSRHWTNEAVICDIISRLHAGCPINAVSVRRENMPLFRAAARLFRNWHNALLAARLNPAEHERRGVVTNKDLLS